MKNNQYGLCLKFRFKYIASLWKRKKKEMFVVTGISQRLVTDQADQTGSKASKLIIVVVARHYYSLSWTNTNFSKAQGDSIGGGLPLSNISYALDQKMFVLRTGG